MNNSFLRKYIVAWKYLFRIKSIVTSDKLNHCNLMQPNKTPFADNDMIRRTKFSQLYYWGLSNQMTPTNAYYMAKKKTLKLYPIT